MTRAKIIICPGIHSPQLTDNFIQSLESLDDFSLSNYLVLPTKKYAAYSPFDIREFLRQNLAQPSPSIPLLFLAFSAGVVGAIGAANIWQLSGGKLTALIAFDGWGVPLIGNFPIYRVSHDYFTHWSSGLISFSQDSFYAQPDVTHLDLWRWPHNAWGWWEKPSGLKVYTNAAEFIKKLINQMDKQLESDYNYGKIRKINR